MRRVVSRFLPHLAFERIRRAERAYASRPEPRVLVLPVDDNPKPCSVPRGGSWRPVAHWTIRNDVERPIATPSTFAGPPMRELGRPPEAAQHPVKGDGTVVGVSRAEGGESDD